MENIWLSKSKLGRYRSCPLSYKYCYIDKILGEIPEHFKRGLHVHKLIENFYMACVKYDNGKYIFNNIPPELENFAKREKERAKNCSDPKYFFPVAQELRISDANMKLIGIIDAIFLNPDGTYTIIDWKTGKFREERKSEMRKELYIYKYLLEKSGKISNKVSKFGMYFTDQDILFLEEPKDVTWKFVLKEIEKTTINIINNKFDAKPSPLCTFCMYFKDCEYWGENDE